MNKAQQRKALREMYGNRKKTISNTHPEFPFQWSDDYEQHKHRFHPKAHEVFQNRAHSLVYEYNTHSHKYWRMYDVIELLGLLGLKTAQDNPLEKGFSRQFALVRHFGFTCQKKDVDKAREKLIRIINDMAASDWLIASLVNLGSIELGVNPMFPSIKDRVAVFSYVAVKQEAEQHVTQLYGSCEFKEGAVPPEFT